MLTESIPLSADIVDLLQEIAIQLGLEVVTAFDGRQALNVFEEQMPDFVLMDISMPVMGGMQAMELMKQINAGCPIILITAFGTVDIAIEAIQNGAFEYIVKPYFSHHLLLILYMTFSLPLYMA